MKQPQKGRRYGGGPTHLIPQMQELAAAGLSRADIAARLELKPAELERWIRDSEVIREVIERGEALAVAAISEALFRKACDGDVGAMRILLKRYGWKTAAA